MLYKTLSPNGPSLAQVLYSHIEGVDLESVNTHINTPKCQNKREREEKLVQISSITTNLSDNYFRRISEFTYLLVETHIYRPPPHERLG